MSQHNNIQTGGRQFAGQKFTSVEDVQNYIKGFGVAAPLILIIIQALQVVIPVLPGYLGCAAGAVAFGSVQDFGVITSGSARVPLSLFFLARKYGMDIVLTMFSEKQYKRWCRKIEKSRNYERFLLIAAVLPLFPDDFLCYFSGMVKMNSKKFIWIIILGKPWCILTYSIVFGFIK